MDRTIARTYTTAAPAPGFAGPGHTAVEVLDANQRDLNDPFLLLMDDRLEDRRGGLVGAAHPHAGLETATLLLEGTFRDGDAAPLHAGDLQWMTAGSGIVHDEAVSAQGRMRILQLWITLPHDRRWTTPAFQDVHLASLPIRREPGVEVRLYSGRSGALASPTRNQVPVTLAQIALEARATVDQELPASYNGFIYVLDGSVRIGAEVLRAGQVGWLDRPAGDGPSNLAIEAEADGARLVLYAGQPQHVPVVMHGPFVGESQADIARLYREYRQGRFARMSELARPARAAPPVTSA